VGVDTAVVRLNVENGYYRDELIRIELPSETDEVVKYAKKVPGIDQLIDDLVLQINRSAEDAAAMAAPVFKEAILSMNVEDAWSILNGADSAATLYLKQNTYSKLVDLYQPIMKASLEKPLVANVSAMESWDKITGNWNKFAGSFAGKLLKVKTVNYDLATYSTRKALDGLFVKVADQEKEIRINADARVNSILKKVFAESTSSKN